MCVRQTQERPALAPPETSDAAARVHRILQAMCRDHYVAKPLVFVLGSEGYSYNGAGAARLRRERGLVPSRSPSATEFTACLIEDRVGGESSYTEIISSTHKAVMAQLQQ